MSSKIKSGRTRKLINIELSPLTLKSLDILQDLRDSPRVPLIREAIRQYIESEFKKYEISLATIETIKQKEA